MTERYDDTERRLSAALQAMASEAPAPAGLWARVASRLDELGTARSWWGGRLRLAAMGAAAAVVLVVGGVGTAQLAAGQFSGNDSEAVTVGGDFFSFQGADDSVAVLGPRGSRGLAGPAGADGQADNSVAFDPGWTSTEQLASITETPIPAPAPQADAGLVVDSERQVISRASLDVEVTDVSAAITRLRALIESVGGFIEQVSTSGGPNPESGYASVRVPSERFLDALDSIERLGKPLGQSLGQQDVTGEVIDLEARLRSELRTEESLLKLLDRAVSVSDVLTVERELSRVRANVERLQGQIDFISKSVALATITVTFSLPPNFTATAPSASLWLEVGDVEGSVQRIRNLVSEAGGTMGQVTVLTSPEGSRATLSSRVPVRAFDSFLASATIGAVVLHRETRRAGLSQEAPDESLVARVEIEIQSPDGSNRWLTVGLPVGGALVLLIVAGAVLTRRRRRV